MLGKAAVWHQFSPCLPMLMSGYVDEITCAQPCLPLSDAHSWQQAYSVGTAHLPPPTPLCFVLSDGFLLKWVDLFFCLWGSGHVSSEYELCLLAAEENNCPLPNCYRSCDSTVIFSLWTLF